MLKKLTSVEQTLPRRLFGKRIARCIVKYTWYGSSGKNKILRYLVRWLFAPIAILTSKYTLPVVNMDVTKRCNLNCKECARLNPLFKERGMARDYPLSQLLSDIDLICSLVRKILKMTLFGGEPFIYPDLHHVINRVANEPKIKYVGIFTNGTVMPSEPVLAALKSKKVVVQMSSYKKLSKQKQNLINLFKKEGIKYQLVNEKGDWREYGELKRGDKTYEAMQKQYHDCELANFYYFALADGRAYKCGRSMVGYQLGIISDHGESEFFDYINLKDMSGRKEFFQKIDELRKDPDKQKSCYYCMGRTIGNQSIPKAEQA